MEAFFVHPPSHGHPNRHTTSREPAGQMLSCLRPALKKRKRSLLEARGGGDEPAGTPGGAVGARAPGDETPGDGPTSSAKKAVKFPRGKKCEVAVGSADPDVDRTPIELPFTCDGCAAYILTARHNCGGCEDFDLCEPCFRKHEGVDPSIQHDHPASVFVVVPSAEEEEDAAAGDAGGAAAGAAEAGGAGLGAGEDAEGSGGGGGTGGGGLRGEGYTAVRMGTHVKFHTEEDEKDRAATALSPATAAAAQTPAVAPVIDSHPLSPASFRR